MKKLRLNKIFHWLYAFLMFLPILHFLGQFLICFGTGKLSDIIPFESLVFDVIGTGFSSDVGIAKSIWSCFDYVLYNVFGMTQFSDGFTSLFTYWVVISLAWLVFDVLMYLINLFHKWIDEGGI